MIIANGICYIKKGDGPIIATAIHAGHTLRSEVLEYSNLTDKKRLQEEDPFTDIFASAANTYVVMDRSRFEVDVNRPREKAVYKKPEDAWGLDLWKKDLPEEVVKRSLAEYDLFYQMMEELIEEYLKKYEKLIILDLHSYNHRRKGPKAPFDDPIKNPEINIGTKTIVNKEKWQNIIDIVLESMSEVEVMNRYLDVRENVKFGGGNMSKWINEKWGDRVVSIAVEFKKIFMNEWSGKADFKTIYELKDLVSYTIERLKLAL